MGFDKSHVTGKIKIVISQEINSYFLTVVVNKAKKLGNGKVNRQTLQFARPIQVDALKH